MPLTAVALPHDHIQLALQVQRVAEQLVLAADVSALVVLEVREGGLGGVHSLVLVAHDCQADMHRVLVPPRP